MIQGRIDGDVFVDDERDANRLRGRTHVGEMRSGGGLRLSPVEAAHQIHHGRLDVGAPWTDLIAGHEATYLAYADLRDRGLVVRHDGDDFLVWERGQGPPNAPWFRFVATSERVGVTGHQLLQWAKQDVVIGVVDDDGAVTHYKAEQEAPAGDGQWPGGHATGVAMDDRVIVPGGLPGDHAMGTMHGDDLVLSVTEAEALRRRGVLDVDMSGAGRGQHHFGRTLPVYTALRDAGVVAKSGFRFGTHLRGYTTHPDDSHAQWLIQCVHDDDVLHWSELSRAVRLAHGVRKTFLVAQTSPVAFAKLSWFRP